MTITIPTKSSGRLRAVTLLSAVIIALGLSFAPTHAQARVFFGIGVGVPFYAPGYAYPAYAPYYYAPYYYSPVYAPAPAYYATPAAQPAAPPTYDRSNCRQVTNTQTIDGYQHQITGTACRQPDGSWRYVQ